MNESEGDILVFLTGKGLAVLINPSVVSPRIEGKMCLVARMFSCQFLMPIYVR